MGSAQGRREITVVLCRENHGHSEKETTAICGRLVQITFQSFSNVDPRESVISRGRNDSPGSIVVVDVLDCEDNTALLLSLVFLLPSRISRSMAGGVSGRDKGGRPPGQGGLFRFFLVLGQSRVDKIVFVGERAVWNDQS
jgi:hypothetical protein